jgi:hypothetical protein
MTVMSYMGTMFFGLVACADTVPDVWDIAAGLESSLDELRKAAEQQASAPAPAPA